MQEESDAEGSGVANGLVIYIYAVEEESEESYAKRMKKINYLSLAQEFAELKKMDANALPFGLTCTTLAGISDGEEDGEERSTSVLVRKKKRKKKKRRRGERGE